MHLPSILKKWLFFTFLMFASARGEGGLLHVIMVADTVSEDLAQSVILDMNKFRLLMSNVAKYTDLNLHEVAFQGAETRLHRVVEAVNHLKVGADDVVVFYFSGHGVNKRWDSGNPWPDLYFPLDRRGLSHLHMANLLAKKRPRLVVAIADCCNGRIADISAMMPSIDLRRGRKNTKRLSANYKKLFMETSGLLMISASIAGEPAKFNQNGGIFTTAFVRYLEDEVAKQHSGEASWSHLLDSVAYAIGHIQHPQYEYMTGCP